MNYSRVQNSQKNQKQHVPTNVAMPQSQMARRCSSVDLSEHCLYGFGSSLECLVSLASDSSNSSSSSTPPTAPKSSDQPSKIPFQKQKAALGIKDIGRPGFLSLLANKEAGSFQNKHIVVSYRLQLQKRLSGVSSPIEIKTTSEKTGDEMPDASNPDDKPLKNPTSMESEGPIQFGSRQGIRFRHESPCVFSLTSWRHSAAPPPRVFSDNDLISRSESATSSEIRGHAIINPEGNACFRPLTFCTVHKSAGVLRLEDIQDSECYCRLDLRIPVAKVTHMFNECILKFPPSHTELIVFKAPNKAQKAIMDGFLSLPAPPPPPPPPPPPMKGNRYLYSSKSPSLPVNFLRYCIECNKVLAPTSNVYMYRGDTWFCSPECRYSNTKKKKELEAKEKLELRRQRAKAEWANRAKAVKESEDASGKHKNKGKGKLIFFIG